LRNVKTCSPLYVCTKVFIASKISGLRGKRSSAMALRGLPRQGLTQVEQSRFLDTQGA
jgi:hypothetical protein